MPQENVIAPKAPRAPAAPVAHDFSDEIVRFVEKRPEDRVTCKRVSGDNYRCNWWSPASDMKYDNPLMTGLLVTTHVVRKSRFLTVTKNASGLVVNDWTPALRGGRHPMNRTDEQEFLIAANTVAAVHDYFHWRVVGSLLKWPELKSVRMLRYLNEQLLVAAEHGEEARLLPAGRQLARELLAMDKQSQTSARK